MNANRSQLVDREEEHFSSFQEHANCLETLFKCISGPEILHVWQAASRRRWGWSPDHTEAGMQMTYMEPAPSDS